MKNSKRYEDFICELENISQHYGVVIQVVGGVIIYDEPLKTVEYTCDESSGDIIPIQVVFDPCERRKYHE